jgi:hypothetical protein
MTCILNLRVFHERRTMGMLNGYVSCTPSAWCPLHHTGVCRSGSTVFHHKHMRHPRMVNSTTVHTSEGKLAQDTTRLDG